LFTKALKSCPKFKKLPNLVTLEEVIRRAAAGLACPYLFYINTTTIGKVSNYFVGELNFYSPEAT